MNRLFVLRERVHFDNLIAALGANWQAAAASGVPLGVTVAPYRRSRSQEANSLMWVWLHQLADQAWIGGLQYSADVWHEHAKRELLPETNARGDVKWRDEIDGTRTCIMSTTRLDAGEMATYMDKFGALAASLGVELK